MSYLGPLRLHFAGQFQADVSTVNNDPTHFNNATFQPSFQKLQDAQHANGWFNPQGDAAFRLKGCAVTSAWAAAGQVTTPDPVLGYLVADSDRTVPAKLVDLDSCQQLVSTIWGLRVRITDANGKTVLSGAFEPAAFIDIWDRAIGGGGDIGACATYQSVLTDLEWGDISASPFLTELHAASGPRGRLSIKFMVDSLNANFRSPDFMCGRIVGTIGPASVGEPQHMVIGRRFMASPAAGGNFFNPAGKINFCTAVVDDATSTVYLDLGNALHTVGSTGAISDTGDLTLGVRVPPTTPDQPATVSPLGVIPSQGGRGYAGDPNWYPRTAGIVALPLTSAGLAQVAASPLAITGPAGSQVVITERLAGTFVRADSFVFRLSPGDMQDIPVYANQWGRPLVGAVVAFTADSGQLQPLTGVPVATPPNAVSFNGSATTNGDGVALLRVTAGDPGKPRWAAVDKYGIDGQVYGIRPALADPSIAAGPVNQWDFISLLVWSGFSAPTPVTWYDVQPIFQQYANLYPAMLRFLNLADHDEVVANAYLLELAFNLPITDPNTMPVTRDLSPAKRRAVLSWLADPLQGIAQPEARERNLAAAEPAAVIDDATPASTATNGGKAAAAARRLILTTDLEGSSS